MAATKQGAAEQMAATTAADKKYDFATDVLVDILLRLPPSSRRRARLVCRHWRGAVDDRTSEMQSRAVRNLISVQHGRTASGYVVDDLSGWRSSKRWAGDGDHSSHVSGTMGTRNGNEVRGSPLSRSKERQGYTSLDRPIDSRDATQTISGR
jgi:hypothetical protein